MNRHPSDDHAQSHHGAIRDVFGHRFVLDTDNGPILADISPHAPNSVQLTPGAKVKITGDKTPCEIKVRLFQNGNDAPIEIPHKPKKKHPHEKDGDPAAAKKTARAAGYMVAGEPRRKPKHFELEAARDGRRYELHISLDGDIRKEKPLRS